MCVCVWWRWTTCKHQQTPSVVRCVSSVFICVSSVLEIYTKSICSWNWMFLGCDFPMYWGQCTSNPFTVFCSQGCLGRISNSFWSQDVLLDGSRTQRKLNDWMSSFDPSAATVRRARHGGKLKKENKSQASRQEMRKTCKKAQMAGALHFVNDMSNEESWTKTCVLKSKTTWSSYATVDGYLG